MPPGCKSQAFGFLVAACVVVVMLLSIALGQARWVHRIDRFPDVGSSRAKSGNGVRAGGRLEMTGESENARLFRSKAMSPPLFGHFPA
jgi:hypothetical protein